MNDRDGPLSLLKMLLKKSSDFPENINSFVKGVNLLIEEVKGLSEVVSRLAATVHGHHTIIADMLAVQEYILRNLEEHALEENRNSLETYKNKSQKPN